MRLELLPRGFSFLQKGVGRSISLSAKLLDLSEFFDNPKNWGEVAVKAGRPWRVDELRRKSSADLHRLWYILLKERNMLMTMEEEHWRRLERMPNPERFEKVEESMENILKVVEERDKAICELERGEWVGPREVEGVDKLGRPVRRLTEEHLAPQASTDAEEEMWSAWTLRYLRAEREKAIRARRESERAERFKSEFGRRRRVFKISDEDLFERRHTSSTVEIGEQNK
ncbi:39S ribosomal protein L47 mitochondrial [Taenia solium]|eukprot:TsM_000772900 transcript=TsM_000772900 gene=TsM_000772900